MRSVIIALALAALTLASASAQETTAVADTTHLQDLSPEDLFLRASSSALQFAPMIAPSRRLLVREHESSLPYLLSKLGTDDVRERIALEDILVRIGEPAVSPLVEAMPQELERRDTSRGARLAVTVLGRLGDARAVSPLVTAVGHVDWKVRSASVSALGKLASPEAVGVLDRELGDDNEVVRTAACVAMGRIAAVEGALPPEAVEGLIARLGDDNYAVRFSAADALAEAGPEAEARLADLAAGGGGVARLMAIRALGETGTRDARRLLGRLTESDSWLVRGHAALALGAAGAEEKDRRRLSKLTSDPHPFVAACARRALEMAAPGAMPAS